MRSTRSAPRLASVSNDAPRFRTTTVRYRAVAPTSYLMFELLRPLASIDDVGWLALLASAADLGAAISFGELP